MAAHAWCGTGCLGFSDAGPTYLAIQAAQPDIDAQMGDIAYIMNRPRKFLFLLAAV